MLWRCRRCGTSFAVGLPYCPQCTSTDYEEDDGMPKNTVHGGASNADLPAEPERAAVDSDRADQGAVAAQDLDAGERDDAPGYQAGTADDLRDMIRRRNEGRSPADRLPVSGTKPELIERLEADDQAQTEGGP